MYFPESFTKIRMAVLALIFTITASLGYLFYDNYKTNLRDKETIKEIKAENLDLSQDLEIMRDKYEKLRTEVDVLKTKVAKISSFKKHYKKKKLYSAGRSSKYKKGKISYKSLYFQLKRECMKKSKYANKSNKYKPVKKYKSNGKYKSNSNNNSGYKYKSGTNYKPGSSYQYKRK